MENWPGSFPHREGARQGGEIAVENSYFSTFSTDFSTWVFHSLRESGKGRGVDIIVFDRKQPLSHFFDRSNFYHTGFLCAKITPLTASVSQGGKGKKRRKIFEKGIDFAEQTRYNVKLYENNGKGDATMPNIKSSKKDVISSKIAYEKNKADKSELKTNLKKFDAALVAGDKTVAEAAYKVAVKSVDQAVIKGLLHKNNAARKKSSMTLKLNKLA